MRFRSAETGAAAFAEPSMLTCQVSKKTHEDAGLGIGGRGPDFTNR